MAMKRTMQKVEGLVNEIKPPASLSAQQVEIAKKIVNVKMMGNFIVQDFCTANSISTKSYYSWHEKPDFNDYIGKLQNAVIPVNEAMAYQELKKHLLKIPYKPNPTPKEVDLFMDVFSYAVEADKRQRMDALGLSDTNRTTTVVNVEQRKASLMARLTAPVGINKKKN
ncbi:hypothetical protein [Lysinibacillus sp. G4S2]|uniref:hypothetical protein n=1 Tax=Lysinibacillus sp. G4S2 TaxID=3055859 RepID=UPI0025A00FE5|nr:hypothetical protein [Lysinibacillus sp. G4S2]MDM5249632.1 hypothetical protein [Lysinibacillus sp. G4S2]